MTDQLRAAAQAALKFAEFCWRDVPMNEFAFQECERTIEQLRAALAEPSREWQGLTEEYISVLYDKWFAGDFQNLAALIRSVEATLKEKNSKHA